MAKTKPISGCFIAAPMSAGLAERLARLLMEEKLKKAGLTGTVSVRLRRAGDTGDFLQSVNGISRNKTKEAV